MTFDQIRRELRGMFHKARVLDKDHSEMRMYNDARRLDHILT